jgi:hypothetical protein
MTIYTQFAQHRSALGADLGRRRRAALRLPRTVVVRHRLRERSTERAEQSDDIGRARL